MRQIKTLESDGKQGYVSRRWNIANWHDVLMRFVIKKGSVRGNGEKRVFQNNGNLAQSHI